MERELINPCGHCLTPTDRCSESDFEETSPEGQNCMPEAKLVREKCPRCDGHGMIANPAFDGMSTQEMYDDMGYEETDEFLTEYTKRGGMYDVECPCCKGQKVVPQWRIDEFAEEEQYRREVEAEQRMMGMGRY
jgi:hypothetical protein